MKSKLHKKAMISPVFQYIFVLVAGAIILIFFIKLALQTEKGGTEVIKAEVLQMLGSSLQALSVSTYSSGAIPTPPWPQIINLKFGTKANCGKFTIEGQKYYVPIERIVFGPSEMKAKQLQAWTMSWHFPFRTTNLFFLMNSRSKYYLVYNGNEDFVRRISSYAPAASFETEHFPKGFDVKYADSAPASKPETLDMAKVNYFTAISGVAEGLKGSSIKIAPECEEEESYKCYGTVEFYDGNEHKGTSTFIGRELMFGAITADTVEEYECQYGKALDELKRMTDLYITKAEKLKAKKQSCDKYDFMINRLNNMKADIETLRNNPGYDNAGKLANDAESIKNYNDETAGDSNCEMVF